MAGVTTLRKCQIGKEATKGTEVNATVVLEGRGTIQDQAELVFPRPHVGYASGVGKAYIPKVGGLVEWTARATFEQIGYFLNMALEGVAGVQDGAGTDYIYTRSGMTTAVKVPYAYTLELGNNQQEEQMVYGYCPKLHLAATMNQAVMLSATLGGRQVAPGTYTAALTPSTVEEMQSNLGKFYLDASGGTVGDTQVSDTILKVDLDIVGGHFPQYTEDGQKYYSHTAQRDPTISMDVTFIHNSTAVTEVAAWRARTVRLLQWLIEGSTVATPGTVYSKKSLVVNMAGLWSKFDKIDEVEGNDVVKGTFIPHYSSTDTLFFTTLTVNELAALV